MGGGKHTNIILKSLNPFKDFLDALRFLKYFTELPKRVNKFDINLFKKNIEEDLNLNIWLPAESNSLYITNDMVSLDYLKDITDYLKDYTKTLQKMNVTNIPKYLLDLVE